MIQPVFDVESKCLSDEVAMSCCSSSFRLLTVIVASQQVQDQADHRDDFHALHRSTVLPIQYAAST